MTLVARLPLKTRGGGDGLQPIRDLDQIRSFLSSAGPSALFDLPWMPLYVGICFLFHPLIGIAAAIGRPHFDFAHDSGGGSDASTDQGRGRVCRHTSRATRSQPAQCRSYAGDGHGRSLVGAFQHRE